MNFVKPLLFIIGFIAVMAGIQPPPAIASVGEQRLQIDEDWIFQMRGDLSVQFAPDRVIVASKNLKLTVLENYPYGPIKPNYITIDLVNKNQSQKGWNVLSTTRQLGFGPPHKTMNRGDAHLFSFTESIPFQLPPNFKYEEHWLVLTVHETNQRGSGTVHAHTKPFARPTTSVAPVSPSRSSFSDKGLSSSPVASESTQQLQINKDWIFIMRGQLSAQFSSDGIVVSTNNLSLRVLDNYRYAPLTANYVTIDLVNRNPGQRGWNVLSTTREIKFGRVVRSMDRGDTHVFSFTESIPYKFPSDFQYGDHWLVLTVSTTSNGSSGTVHAHTERLRSPNVVKPPAAPPPIYERVFYDDGAFELSVNGNQRVWTEKKERSSHYFQFVESSRTDYWITLYDPIRKLSVRLPRQDGPISESTNNGRQWRDLYNVKTITSSPEKVSYDGGVFERFDRNGLPVWYETGKNQELRFMFVETDRTPEQITIYDPTRNVTIRLPKYEGMIALSTNNGASWRDVYKVQPLRISSPQSKLLPPQEVIFTPSSDARAAHLGSANLSSTGPFLVLKFSDYLIRTDDRNQGGTVNVADIRFRLVSKSKMPDGTHIIRESEPVSLNLRLKDRISRGLKLPDVKIPIDGIPFDDLGDYRLIAEVRMSDGAAGILSEAYPSIDPSRLL